MKTQLHYQTENKRQMSQAAEVKAKMLSRDDKEKKAQDMKKQ